MPRLGFMEIMLIMVAVLLLFGAKRLPEIGQSMGKGIREFKRSISGAEDMLSGEDAPGRMGEGNSNGTATRNSAEPKRLSQ